MEMSVGVVFLLFWTVRARRLLAAGLCLLAGLAAVSVCAVQSRAADSYIKYVEFNVPYAALHKAMEDDISCGGKVSWIDTLAYLAAKYGGEWGRYKAADMDAVLEKLHGGEDIAGLTRGMKYFPYFREAYGAVLGGLLGDYVQELPGEEGEEPAWTARYGLRAYSPVAEGYYYNDFDDFGASRSYGFARQHMGHDLMGSVGTPIVAVETGTVEVMGWNQYGGWRIGIRSLDQKRYWYYAHLRKDHPFQEGLREGDRVTAGQVIGYLGQTGYSSKENVNGIETPHLHYGLELVFEEKQKESNNEIWVDLYALTRLLSEHRSTVYREGKEYYRMYDMIWCGTE